MIVLYEITGKYKWVYGLVVCALLWASLPYIAAAIQIVWSWLPGIKATVGQAYHCGAMAAGICALFLWPADWLYEGFRREIYPAYLTAIRSRGDRDNQQ